MDRIISQFTADCGSRQKQIDASHKNYLLHKNSIALKVGSLREIVAISVVTVAWQYSVFPVQYTRVHLLIMLSSVIHNCN